MKSLRILTVLLAALGSLFLVVPANAADITYLRLAHLSPDTPAVDVYVANIADPASTAIFKGVGYGVVSAYQKVPAGTYTISMRAAGAAASSPPVISTTVNATAGAAYTIAGVGTFAKLGLAVLNDDLSLPPAGSAKARVIEASVTQPQVNLSLASGSTLGTDVKFATATAYTDINAGAQTLVVSADGQTVKQLPVTLQPGAVYSVLVLDSPNGLVVTADVDSVATAVVPIGGVQTGGGGTATQRLPLPQLIVMIGLAAALIIGLRLRRSPK